MTGSMHRKATTSDASRGKRQNVRVALIAKHYPKTPFQTVPQRRFLCVRRRYQRLGMLCLITMRPLSIDM